MSASKQAVVTRKEQAIAPASIGPSELLQIAVQQGADLEKLEKLMELKERYEANEARKAFHAAMSQFKSHDLRISKNHLVKFSTSKGVTEYWHSTLDNICRVIDAPMSECELSYAWDVEQSQSGVTVTCIITHALGHSKEVKLTGQYDTSGNKNSIQSLGSTVTYLQRYSLLSALGLATESQDDDGAQAEPPVGEVVETLTDTQITDMRGALERAGITEPAFLKQAGIASLADMPASRYAAARRYLSQAIADKKEEAAQ